MFIRNLAGGVAVLTAGLVAVLSAEAKNKSVKDVLYPDSKFVRMPFNTPGTVEVGCGYLGRATPVDADGDGDWDLSVFGAGYGGGVRYYENTGDPFVLKKGVRGRSGFAGWRFSMSEKGGYRLTSRDRYASAALGKRPGADAALGVGTNNVHWGRCRCNSWMLKDYDGDGREDIIVGVGDWVDYGWHQKYDGLRQAWTNANCRGLVYLLRNLGERGGRTVWSEQSLVRIENGAPVETMGNPHPMLEDWDGDGDLDFILSDFPGSFTYFENVGTRTKPVYTSGRLMRDSKGALFASPQCVPVPQAIDWDRDGRLDILAGQEDSRVCFYRNTGRIERGLPVFDPPVFIRAERDDLRFGALASPWVCDYDGDGDQDIVVGDSAGYLAWFENLSGPGVANPKWEGPHYIECAEPTDGYVDVTIRPDTFQAKPFKHRAGHNGSIQGPVEAGFGYTCQSVADWDGDGDLDIIYNQIWGKPMLLENIGTRRKPRYAAPRGIEVEWGEGGQPRMDWDWFTPERTGNPKEIVTQWRTTPVMVDMNNDGLMDLVMADPKGYLVLYERFRENGKLRLKAPRRAFLNAKTGAPMGVTGWGEGSGRGKGGGSGRRKICLMDWNGDGRLDLVMNGGLNLILWTQTESRDGTWSFMREGVMTSQKVQNHSTAPTACDFDGDGVMDIVMGGEDGYLYFLKNPRHADSVALMPSGWKFGTAWKMVPGLGRKGGNALVFEKKPSMGGGGIATCRFEVRPGASYRFGAMTKLEKGGKGVMPRLGLRWCDSKGKELKTFPSHAVTDNDPDTRGWTRVEGVSGIAPREAAAGYVLCWMSKMENARALYGEFSVTQTSSAPIEYFQCASYKNTFSGTDGDIGFAAALNLNVVLAPLTDYSCEVEFSGPDGKKAVRTFAPRSAGELVFSIPAKAFASGRQDVALRVVLNGKAVGETRCRVERTEKPVMRRVMFDRYGRTILDGKPFFPIGMFTGRMSGAERRVYSESPFNFVMHYGTLDRKMLDEYAAMGVYAAMDSRSLVYGYDYSAKSPYKTLEESKKAIRKKFAEVGDHPAFISWYLIDECPPSQFKNVRDVNEFLREFDPDHPTYAVTDKPWHVRPMMPCFDVLGIDPYPVGNRGVRADISICSGWVRTAVEGMFGMRPMWHVPQAFNWGWYRKEDASLPNVRMPTRHEMANMTWQGIAAGANGLCAYSFTQVQRQLKGEELKRTWAEVVSVAREVRSFEKVLLSAGTPIAVGGVPDCMEVRAYDCGGEPWVLAVNRTLKPVRAVLRLPRRFSGMEVKAGKGVSLKGEGLAVDMQGLDYAFVRLDPK